MISMPFPMEYIEEDEEALETSFQALEIVGTTSIKVERAFQSGDMEEKVLITNGFEPDKGLGRRLDGIANPVAIQENPRQVRLDYSGTTRKAKTRWKVQSKQQARTSLYHYFTCGGIVTPEHVATVED
ncbi:hypothetical protein CR513_16088, partial [Mucuna pruriens]